VRRGAEEDEDRPSRRRSSAGSSNEMPGKVQAIAIMTLVGGIIGILFGITFIAAAPFVCFTLCWPGTYYTIGMGILAASTGAQPLGKEGRYQAPPTTAAILMIINVINGDLASLVMGILILVFLNEPEIKNWYRG